MTDPTLGLHSLATMVRVLGQPQPLEQVLELAAEGARLALKAATVSLSRFDVEAGCLRTLINVGNLSPNEVRWPTDETYVVDPWPELAQVLEHGSVRSDSLTDPTIDPRERALLEHLGKGHSISAAVLVDGEVWGEFYATRWRGDPRFADESASYVEVLSALLGSAISRALQEEGATRR